MDEYHHFCQSLTDPQFRLGLLCGACCWCLRSFLRCWVRADLYTPFQVLFGVDFHMAATASLFLIMVTFLSATLVYRKAHKVDWPLAIVLESATATGGFVGGVGSAWFSARILIWVLAVVLCLAAGFMIRFDRWFHPVQMKKRLRWYRWQRFYNGQSYAVNLRSAGPAS